MFSWKIKAVSKPPSVTYWQSSFPNLRPLLLDDAFRNPTPETARHAICPSHYMGILDLYRTTGERRYLELAQRLAELPRVGGLEPRVIKALVEGWQRLHGPPADAAQAAADAYPSVAIAGGNYLPVYTDVEQYFAFAMDKLSWRKSRSATSANAFCGDPQWMMSLYDDDAVDRTVGCCLSWSKSDEIFP